MKMTPELIKAQANMAPGIITSGGFIGTDERKISDIIETDEENMQALKLSFDEVTKKLRHLESSADRGLGEPITVDGKWIVKVDQTRGSLACPFEDGIFEKLGIQVEHIQSGETIIFSELSLHLIEHHHFLQGKGSPFRLDPRILKKVLEL